jgi:hypothetical protein
MNKTVFGSNRGSFPSSQSEKKNEDSVEDEEVIMNRPGIRILKMDGESDQSSEEKSETDHVADNLIPRGMSSSKGGKSANTMLTGKSKFACNEW